MGKTSGQRRVLIVLATIDIAMATIIVGLLVVVAVLLGGYLFVLILYQQAFVGLCSLLGAISGGLYVHGFALIGDISRKESASKGGRFAWIVQGLIPAALYSAFTIAGIVFFSMSSVAFGSLLQDIGAEYMNPVVFLSVASLVILCTMIVCHLALLKSKEATGALKVAPRPAPAVRRLRFPTVTRQGIGKFQAVAMLAVIAGTAVTYGLTVLFTPPRCFSGIHGFSAPVYDLATLQSSPHVNVALDNTTNVNQSVLMTLERALWKMTTTQSQGGFPLRALLDGSEFYADRGASCPLFPGEFSIQDGTPLITSVYLAMYEVEPNPVYLGVATAAARALMAVQDEVNGGFYYEGRLYPDGTAYQPHPLNSKRAAIFDDDTTQSALSFLLAMYDATGNATYMNAAVRGLDYLFQLEKPGGGWPQRSNYSPDEYQSYVTLNDDCMQDIMNLMFKAYDILGGARYMQAAERAGQFLIRVQGHGNGSNPMQSGAWAQQYKSDQPAWARRFEPPAMCSIDTARAIDMLMDLYLRTANEAYLDPIPAAVAWLTDSNTTILDVWEGSGQHFWSRLYELETNRLIVGNRNDQDNGVVYFYDYVPSRDFGYAWVGNFGINSTLNNFDYLVTTCSKNISQYIAWRDAPPSVPSLLSGALWANSTIHSSGFWLNNEGEIQSDWFSSNAMRIIDYLGAVA